MKLYRGYGIALACCALLWSESAAARDWQVDATASTLGFRGESQGETFDGHFRSFVADIRFDPADPAGGRFDVRITLESVDTQNAERDEMMVDPAFFDVGRQAEARYVAERFEALGGGRFRADGVLALNGLEQPVRLEFAFEQQDDQATLDGRAVLDRLQFDVGSGDWADPDTIAREVQVHTRLVLRPATP